MNRFVLMVILVSITSTSWASDFFAEPSKACTSLVGVGIYTDGWHPSKAFPGEWVCLSRLEQFGSPGSNGLKNNIAFYAYGKSKTRANDYRIKINVNNPSQKSDAFERLDSAVEHFFKSMSVSIPTGLSNALRSKKPGVWNTTWGKAELILEEGRIESYKVVVTQCH